MSGKNLRFKAVILAGGSGERFWPLSTPERPKQFLDVFGGESLIRQAALRLKGMVKFEDIFVVTAKSLVAATRKELPELPKENVIGEPMRRDTAAAVALGVEAAGEGIIGFFPADQLIGDVNAFRKSLEEAIEKAGKSSRIVTLGIKPTYPATGFGYINPKTGKFVEKPDATKAKRYLKSGYLWNAGMFIASRETFRAEFAKHAPYLLGLKATRKVYAELPKISFDYAIMEKQERVEVEPSACDWDDVGSYAAFEKRFAKDANGNVLSGAVRVVEGRNSIVIGNGTPVSVLGIDNLVVVSTKAGVLVMPKEEIPNLKKLFATK